MTSLIPSNQSHDLKHMYNVRDLRANTAPTSGRPNSLYGIIASNPDFTLYRRLVILAGMEGVLQSEGFNGTLLIPSDTFLENTYATQLISNMDTATAKAYIRYSMLSVKTTEKNLRASPFYKLRTMNPSVEYIDVKNLNNTCILNDVSNIVKFNIQGDNGVIHIIDRLLIPPSIV